MAITIVWRRWGWVRWLAPLVNARTDQDRSEEGSAPDGAVPQLASTRGGDLGRVGDEFEAFFQEHERAVYAYLWRLSGDPQTARDLTQETFVRAWRHFERVRSYEQPLAWLLRVATNLARTSHRRQGDRPLSTETLTDADTPARSDPMLRLAERDAVEQTLLALPPNQRAALTLREVYGFSCAEIGSMLGLSRDAVKMALLRGREGFRRRYLGREATDER